MKLSNKTITTLAEMICGAAGGAHFEWSNFPYRSSTKLSEFFSACDLSFAHDGSTRKWWVLERLQELNGLPAPAAQLPSGPLIRVIQEMLDRIELEQAGLDPDLSVKDVNGALRRDGLEAYYDGAGRAHVRSTGDQTSSAGFSVRRAWTKEEVGRRKALETLLEQLSEDEFIERILAPLLAQLGFQRISLTGHKDKALEYGKDLWWKYQLPTNHYLYFAAQVKKGKLDATGRSTSNIAEVLNQVTMLLGHPIWDPELNKRVLLDHAFVVSAGDITKQAKQWLGERLDAEGRRHIIFLDREEILDLAISVQLRFDDEEGPAGPSDADSPF